MPHCRLLPTPYAVNFRCFNANKASVMDATKTNWSQTVPPERSCGEPEENIPLGSGASSDSSAIHRNISSSGSAMPIVIACSRTLRAVDVIIRSNDLENLAEQGTTEEDFSDDLEHVFHFHKRKSVRCTQKQHSNAPPLEHIRWYAP